MNIENIQMLPSGNYTTVIGSNTVQFIKVGGGFTATFEISDFSRVAIWISENDEGDYSAGTTDIDSLEPNGYNEEEPIEDASLEIQDGNVEIVSSGASQQYSLGSYDVAVKILNGTMTAYIKRK